MSDLLETLRNTDTGMAISSCELGLRVSFVHMNAGGPKKFEFIISDMDIGAFEYFDINRYMMLKLEWFLEQLGIKTHA